MICIKLDYVLFVYVESVIFLLLVLFLLLILVVGNIIVLVLFKFLDINFGFLMIVFRVGWFVYNCLLLKSL